jgi:hypothetical protein
VNPGLSETKLSGGFIGCGCGTREGSARLRSERLGAL